MSSPNPMLHWPAPSPASECGRRGFLRGPLAVFISSCDEDKAGRRRPIPPRLAGGGPGTGWLDEYEADGGRQPFERINDGLARAVARRVLARELSSHKHCPKHELERSCRRSASWLEGILGRCGTVSAALTSQREAPMLTNRSGGGGFFRSDKAFHMWSNTRAQLCLPKSLAHKDTARQERSPCSGRPGSDPAAGGRASDGGQHGECWSVPGSPPPSAASAQRSSTM